MTMWDGVCRNKKLVRCGDAVIDCGGDRLITEWIDPRSYGAWRVFVESIPLARQFAEQYRAYGFSMAHYLIYAIWGWVNKNVSYKYDEKYVDYWDDPSELYSEPRFGDCEDASILCQSAIECALPYDVAKKFYTKLAIGYVTIQNSWYGHAWVYYYCDEPLVKKRVVLECTLDDVVKPTMFIEGVTYHPTVLATSRSYEVVCTCERCKAMLAYLSGTATREKVNWARVKLSEELKEVTL